MISQMITTPSCPPQAQKRDQDLYSFSLSADIGHPFWTKIIVHGKNLNSTHYILKCLIYTESNRSYMINRGKSEISAHKLNERNKSTCSKNNRLKTNIVHPLRAKGFLGFLGTRCKLRALCDANVKKYITTFTGNGGPHTKTHYNKPSCGNSPDETKKERAKARRSVLTLSLADMF